MKKRIVCVSLVVISLLPLCGCGRRGRIVRTGQHSSSSGQRPVDPADQGCPGNLKHLATACEMFATDHQGKYPVKLSELTPQYLKEMPKCPEAGRDTYSDLYVANNVGHPQLYTMCCQGKNHSLGENLPSFNSQAGLVTK